MAAAAVVVRGLLNVPVVFSLSRSTNILVRLLLLWNYQVIIHLGICGR